MTTFSVSPAGAGAGDQKLWNFIFFSGDLGILLAGFSRSVCKIMSGGGGGWWWRRVVVGGWRVEGQVILVAAAVAGREGSMGPARPNIGIIILADHSGVGCTLSELSSISNLQYRRFFSFLCSRQPSQPASQPCAGRAGPAVRNTKTSGRERLMMVVAAPGYLPELQPAQQQQQQPSHSTSG